MTPVYDHSLFSPRLVIDKILERIWLILYRCPIEIVLLIDGPIGRELYSKIAPNGWLHAIA
jgi:hypothetical protein